MNDVRKNRAPAESSPFDRSLERCSMSALEAFGLPETYWDARLRGRP